MRGRVDRFARSGGGLASGAGLELQDAEEDVADVLAVGRGVALAGGDEVTDAQAGRLLVRDVFQAQHLLQHVTRAQVTLHLELGVDGHHGGEALRLQGFDGLRLRVVGGAGLLQAAPVPDVERHGRRHDAAVDRGGRCGLVVVDGVVVAHRVTPVGDRRGVHGMAGDLGAAGGADMRACLGEKRCMCR